MGLLDVFRRLGSADGGAVALEAVATGISPALLAAAEADLAPSRRAREAATGSSVVAEALAQKVLHGWLQNRHQVMMPLTLNFRVLSAEQRTMVVTAMAALLLAGRPAADAAEAAPGLQHWLVGVGADTATTAAFQDALGAPPALHAVLERTQGAGLTVYTYVAALMASDPRFPASALLCDVVQARFDLPSAVVRSAIRRYRR